MDIHSFYRYLNSELEPGDAEIKELEAAVSKHPWFFMGRVLLLKALKNTGARNYRDACNTTALYAPNRKRLYEFIENRQPNVSAPTEKRYAAPSRAQYSENERNDRNITSILGKEYFSPSDFSDLINYMQSHGSQDDMIAEFIKKSPNIPKITPDEPDEQSKIDLADADEPGDAASEVLADIYVAQGLYGKAIDCLERLSLLNPEKSIYFAHKIERIKMNLMN
jgi:tetratricopeptide (TPR) repeat protein